jgi:outer membrane immunogenic protein
VQGARVMGALRSFTVAVALAAGVLPAFSADLPVTPAYPVRPAVVIFRWTGVYLGPHVGGAWGFKDEVGSAFPLALTTTPAECPVGAPYPCASISPLPTTVDVSGWFAGGQIGANYQIDSLVIGIEGEGSWANFTGSNQCPANAVRTVVLASYCSVKLDSLGTAAVRLGWAFDRLLLYGKGGAAWTNDNYQVKFTTLLTPILFSANELRWGWMFGIGAEYAFTDNWSAKIEYNYMDLGGDSLRMLDTFGALAFDVNIRERVDTVKIGVNYRFGPPSLLVR